MVRTDEPPDRDPRPSTTTIRVFPPRLTQGDSMRIGGRAYTVVGTRDVEGGQMVELLPVERGFVVNEA